MRTKSVIVVLLVCCAVQAGANDRSVKNRLIAAKAGLMDADYRGDLTRLSSLRVGIVTLKDDPGLGYLADYWSGFASWRIAINGANANMANDDLKMNLDRAAADFESSLHRKDDFADAFAAASSVHGWLAYLNRNDPAVMKSHIDTSVRFLARAEELEPSNPRVLWVRGGTFLYLPPSAGGSTDRATEIYQRQVDSAPPLDPHSPLPDWGKAEGLMSLAYAHMVKSSPDLNAAAEEARAALHLQPQWHYVRDILITQIESKRKQGDGNRQ